MHRKLCYIYCQTKIKIIMFHSGVTYEWLTTSNSSYYDNRNVMSKSIKNKSLQMLRSMKGTKINHMIERSWLLVNKNKLLQIIFTINNIILISMPWWTHLSYNNWSYGERRYRYVTTVYDFRLSYIQEILVFSGNHISHQPLDMFDS